MKKLFTLLAIFSIAATMSAQVTFTLIGGSNESWYLDSYTNLNDGGKWWRTNPGANAYVIFKASETTYIQGYTITLTSNSNSDGHLPYTWTLYGSDDQGTWEVIHYQKQANDIVEDFDNPNINVNSKPYTFYCNSKKQYEYYKLNITAKQRGSWGCFQISRFDLIPSNVGISTGSGDALDGKTDTKLEGNVTQTVEIELNSSTTIKGYQFTTANDTQTYPARNPKNWMLQGRSNDSEDWTTIDTKTSYNAMEGKNYYPYTFGLANASTAYKYYKFTFTGVQGGSYLQLSEVALITDLTSCTNYVISSPEDLMSFASFINSGTRVARAKLMADIDMKNVTYTPIGTDSYKYADTFEGNGHSINFAISSSSNQQAFVGVATGGTTIQNLILTGSITSTGSKTGGFIAEAKGGGTVTITNCGNEATITGAGGETAAIVANNWGWQCTLMMTNVYNIADVSGTGDVSTICACQGNGGSIFRNVYNAGNVTGASQGNFVRTSYGTYTNCYSTTLSNDNASIISTNASKVASGELCYKLGNAFRQTIGTDDYPTFDSSSEQVLYVGAAGYTTFYDATNDWELLGDAQAYIGSINGSALLLDEIDDIPAGTAVVIGGTYYNRVSVEATATTTGNVLLGSTGITVGAEDNFYALAEKNDVVGFYPVNTGVQIPAGKAYLNLGSGSSVKGFTFVFEDDNATGINSLTPNPSPVGEGAIYNVAGQKLSKMQKGINIINGKKILK